MTTLKRAGLIRVGLKRAGLFLCLSATAIAMETEDPNMGETRFKNLSEVGVVVAAGNIDTESYNLKQSNTFDFYGNVFKLRAQLLKQDAYDHEIAKYWSAGLRFERKFNENVGVFVGHLIESNKYSGIDRRNSSDAGLGLKIFRTSDAELFSELGYRFTQEDRTTIPNRNSHQGRAYLEGSYQLTDSFTGELWGEYLPNFSHQKDWQANGEISVAVAINSYFSMKTSYLVKYDHEPVPGFKDTDSFLTTSLTARF